MVGFAIGLPSVVVSAAGSKSANWFSTSKLWSIGAVSVVKVLVPPSSIDSGITGLGAGLPNIFSNSASVWPVLVPVSNTFNFSWIAGFFSASLYFFSFFCIFFNALSSAFVTLPPLSTFCLINAFALSSANLIVL